MPVSARPGPGHRPEDQLLVQLGGAAVDRAADQVGVAGLQLARAEHPAGQDPGAEARARAARSAACIRSANRSQSSRSQTPRTPPSPASRARLLRHVRVGPQRLGARRGAGGVGGRHLAGEQERPAGTAPAATCASASDICSTESATWTVPGAYGGRDGPRHRPVERPVDLDRAGVQLEGAHAPRHPAPGGPRRRPGRRRGAGRRRRRPPPGAAANRSPPTGAHPGRPTVLDVDAERPRRVAADLAAQRLQPAGQRLGELAGAALGHREADGLAEHRQQHPHQPGAGRVQRDVGVPGVAGEQQPRRVAAEPGPAQRRRPGSAAS